MPESPKNDVYLSTSKFSKNESGTKRHEDIMQIIGVRAAIAAGSPKAAAKDEPASPNTIAYTKHAKPVLIVMAPDTTQAESLPMALSHAPRSERRPVNDSPRPTSAKV
mmetsp:Transcript_20446/g.45887  ORF Transcript_20446/g.45887 Transcript_20446/m.45887 type:complete len:108 (-) Transcript_20446:533-856(-)